MVVVLLAWGVAGCGGGAAQAEEKQKKEEAAAAKKAEEEDGIKKRKAEREAKEAAAKQAEADKQEKIKALAVLPDKLPKKLDKACDAVAAAQDQFMVKWFPDQKDQWASGKGTQLGLTKTTCIKGGSIEVAACQASALSNATEDLRKEIPGLFSACIEKFGKKDGDAAAVPPK
jgi:hypothetical protein